MSEPVRTPLILLIALLPWALVACPRLTIGLDDDSSAADDDTGSTGDDDDIVEWGEVEVDYITPVNGPTEGGNTVEIYGSNLDGGGLEVNFGGEVAALLSIDDEHLSVTAPAAAAPGPVDVTVSTDDGLSALESGYTYEFSGEGLDGGRVFLFHQEIPALGDPPTAQALARLYEPDDWDFLDHLPANGACGYNIESPSVYYGYLDAGASVSLESYQYSITMGQTSDATGGPFYQELNAPVNAVQFNATYGLELPGGEGLPAMTIEQVVVSGADFTVFDPDIADPYNTPIWTRNPGATLQWTTGGVGETRMLIQLISVDPNGNPTGGNLTCTSNDGGGFVFGPVELAYLQAGLNYLYVSRYDIRSWANPYNGSDGQGVFVVTKIGVILLVD